MTTPNAPSPPRPTRATVAGALATMVVLAAWFMLYGHNNPAARECLALYRAAHTAADSAQVDTTEPPQSHEANRERRSCQSITSFGRWWAARR